MSISVTELGSLLDHTGPHLEAEEYIARTFGAEQSYMVTNLVRRPQIKLSVCMPRLREVRYLLIVIAINRWRIC